MEAGSSKSETHKEVGQRRKKKRGGMKFSGSKALRRSALRKRDAPAPSDDNRLVDDVESNEVDKPGAFRRSVKIRSLNLDTVVENVDAEEGEDGGDWNDVIEEHESIRLSTSRSDSLGSEHGCDEVGIDTVVSLTLIYEKYEYNSYE